MWHVNKNHKHWHQMQLEILMTGSDQCDLVVWSPKEKVVVPVMKDPSWETNMDLMLQFYQTNFFSRLCGRFMPETDED